MYRPILSSQEIKSTYPGVYKIYLFLIEKRGEGISSHLETHISRFIRRNQKFVKEVETLYSKYLNENSMHHFFKSRVVKQSIKELQKELHTTYSQFLSSNESKKEQILKNADSISELLSIHKSTQERVESYQEIYSYLLKQFITKHNENDIKNNITILDIGCGMNPLSIESFVEQCKLLRLNSNCKNIKWIGCDVHQDDMNYLQRAYSKFNYSGNFFSCDLTREDDREKLKTVDADVLFAFKILDSLEHIERNVSFELLKNLNYKIGVISFATYSLGRRKKIPITKRAWVLKFLEREKWPYSIYETDNEAYIVYKKK